MGRFTFIIMKTGICNLFLALAGISNATAKDNILILDLPPDRSGRLREKDRQLVFALRKLVDGNY